MYHSCYDCKCFGDPDYYGDYEELSTMNVDSPLEEEVANVSADDNLCPVTQMDQQTRENTPKQVNGNDLDGPTCVVMCFNIYNKTSESSQTSWMLKHWSHNGAEHTSRTCGYTRRTVEKTFYVKRYDQGIKYISPKFPFITGTTVKNTRGAINKQQHQTNNDKLASQSNNENNKTNSESSIKNGLLKTKNDVPTNKLSNNNIKNKTEETSKDITVDSVVMKKKPVLLMKKKPLSLLEMMNEEEKRGELELDLSENTPGNKLLVAESRFRKLINMNIIGVLGLNKSGR